MYIMVLFYIMTVFSNLLHCGALSMLWPHHSIGEATTACLEDKI